MAQVTTLERLTAEEDTGDAWLPFDRNPMARVPPFATGIPQGDEAMENIPLMDTARLGKIAKRVEPDQQESAGKRWERELESLPDVVATVERISGALPWTHAVEFENANGERERWLLRGFRPFTQPSE